MIQFLSFKRAINYRQECPLCQCQMDINDRDLATDYEGKERLTFFLNRNEDDTIAINSETDEVELIFSKRMPDKLYDYTKQSYYAPVTPIYNGTLIQALTIDCKHCCQYSYTLQIYFNLTEKKLAKTILNSESLTVEDGSMVHEIKNVYSMERTEYCCFSKEGDSKKSAIPLIPIDLDNPKETIFRIRKLLIFS